MILNKLLTTTFKSDSQSFNVLYDIGCHFHKYVQNHTSIVSENLHRFQFGVSIFHSYSHSPHCQINYNPRRINSFGLADGENLERLWSYLGRFANMTRRMRPNNRLDLLSEALEYFANRTINKLGKFFY